MCRNAAVTHDLEIQEFKNRRLLKSMTPDPTSSTPARGSPGSLSVSPDAAPNAPKTGGTDDEDHEEIKVIRICQDDLTGDVQDEAHEIKLDLYSDDDLADFNRTTPVLKTTLREASSNSNSSSTAIMPHPLDGSFQSNPDSSVYPFKMRRLPVSPALLQSIEVPPSIKDDERESESTETTATTTTTSSPDLDTPYFPLVKRKTCPTLPDPQKKSDELEMLSLADIYRDLYTDYDVKLEILLKTQYDILYVIQQCNLFFFINTQ